MSEVSFGVMRLLAEAATEVKASFDVIAQRLLTDPAKCGQVRAWRIDEGLSWRGVAQAAYDAWDGNWEPSSNQLMGMALCEVAAGAEGQDYMTAEGWNS